MVYCGLGDSFIGYGNEGVGKMYCGFAFVSGISVVKHGFCKIATSLLF